MTRYGHIGWRVAAVAMAFVGTAVLAVTLTHDPDSPYVASQTSSAAIRDTSVRPQPVTLEPGATAHSVLRVTDTGRSRPAACDQVTAEGLRVTFPDQVRSAFLPVHIPMCSQGGALVSQRPGHPGQAGHPRVHDALTVLLATCRRSRLTAAAIR
jgi:hypothetical protein